MKRPAFEWPSLLRQVTGVSPDDEAAFDAYAASSAAQMGVLGVSAVGFCTVAWWVTDPLVFPDARHAAAFSALRWRMLAVEVPALLLLLASGFARRHALWVAPLLYAALMASVGLSLGQLGGTDLTLLADAFIGIVPVVLLPARLLPRALWTSVLAASLLGGFWLSYPEPTAPPLALAQVSFLSFTVLLTILLGELALRITRQAFFKARSLARSNDELALLTRSLADTVAERTQELRELAQHLASAQEAERRRIARDLHDDLGQNLTAMRYSLARVEGARGPEVADLLSDLSALLDGTSAAVRGFVTALRPRILDDLGLVAAVEWLCERIRSTTEVACSFEADGDARARAPQLDPEVALALFRVAQEATTNALKHASPRHLQVRVEIDAAQVTVTVADDGAGFDPATARRGLGLLGLRERLRPLGGELRVTSSPHRGTAVVARLPVPGAAP